MSRITKAEAAEVEEMIKREIALRIYSVASVDEDEAYGIAGAIWEYLDSIGFVAPSAQSVLK